MTLLTDAEVKEKGRALFAQRLNEGGVSTLATLANLSPSEQSIASRALREAQALEVSLCGGGRMRESGSSAGQRVQLLELDGVPMVDGADAAASFELAAESGGDGLIVLEGVPSVAGYDHAGAQAAFTSMRESERKAAADDDGAGLLELDGVPMREGTYGVPGGSQTYYEDGQTRQDVSDLYACVPELTPAGSPNLENSKLRGILENVEHGRQMSNVELATVRELLGKYADQVKALRASPDRQGQDLHHVPDAASARVVDRAEQDGEGLIDLGDLRKTPVAA